MISFSLMYLHARTIFFEIRRLLFPRIRIPNFVHDVSVSTWSVHCILC